MSKGKRNKMNAKEKPHVGDFWEKKNIFEEISWVEKENSGLKIHVTHATL